MGTVVEFRGVDKAFATPQGPVRVLTGVDLCVPAGEFVAVTGPSGSGKSTLLNLAALLDKPSAGTLLFDNCAVADIGETELCELRKHRVGMVFQKYCLLPHRSVLENVLFRFRYVADRPADLEKRALEALSLMGLSGIRHRPVRLLSGGEMQRVAIARAVVLPPRLLVADEPTGNLDRRSADAVMDCFRTLNQDGLTILLVTHNEALLEFSTRHFVCSDGTLGRAA